MHAFVKAAAGNRRTSRNGFGRIVLLALALASMCALASAITAAPASAQAGTGSISGPVTNATTTAPVAGALRLRGRSWQPVQPVTAPRPPRPTAPTRSPTSPIVPTSSPSPTSPASARAARTPYVTEYWDNETDFNLADTITISGGSNESGKDAALAPTGGGADGGATISGSRDRRGPPISRSPASACSPPTPRTSSTSLASDTTDASGAYSISNLADRDYKLAFTDETGFCPTGHNAYVSEYWDNKPIFNSADFVSIVSGQSLANRTSSSDPRRAADGGGGDASISGHLTDSESPAHRPPQHLRPARSRPPGHPGIRHGIPTTGRVRRLHHRASRGRPLPARASGPCGNANYVGEYFNGAASSSTATVITLGESEARTGRRRLARGRGDDLRPRHRQRDACERPRGICVTADPATFTPEPSLGSSGFAQTDANGEYSINAPACRRTTRSSFAPCGRLHARRPASAERERGVVSTARPTRTPRRRSTSPPVSSATTSTPR